MTHKNIFIDCEWFLNQRIYLLGYAYNLNDWGQLCDNAVNLQNFDHILRGVENIYVFGPDIGMMEKFFNVDLRNYFRCFNLLTIIKRIEPYLSSYRLCDLEQYAGIERETQEYKSNIFQLHRDWYDYKKRPYALKYNREDVLNLIRVKNYFFQRNGITLRDIEKWRM